ncbi:putative heme-binding peroxidase [Candida tropicalis]
MRFEPELTDDGNTGLFVAMLALSQVKVKYPMISYADLWTLAGKVAIEYMGRPHAGHIRTTFTRLGFNDQQTVVLVGAHGVGRCHKKFSGWDGKWTHDPLVFDNEFYKVLLSETWSQDVVPETGKVQYYNGDRSLIMLNTDMELIRDSRYRQWVEVYAKNKERFLNDFAAAFSKLLELGVKRSCE